MGRGREVRRSGVRRGRRSDPRLRGLSYAERRRVYRRRRVVALVVAAVLLLLLALLVWAISRPGETGGGETSVENASHGLNLGQDTARDAGGPRPEPAEEAPTDTRYSEATGGSSAETLDVLVLGVDRRPAGSFVEGNRADTVMVVRVTPRTGSMKMLSIPRDLFVEIEPGVEDRINAAYSYGGVEQMTEAVEKATGISVDRHAVVDFRGFKDIVNAVGGVTVEIRGEMPPGRHLEGTQTLNGRQALFYARYRGTPGGDLDRMERQQQVVAALREKLVSWGVVSKLPGVMEVVHGNLETDLGLMANLSLARSLLNAEDADSALKSFQLAGEPTVLPDGRQVLVPDPTENEQVLQEFRGEQAPLS